MSYLNKYYKWLFYQDIDKNLHKELSNMYHKEIKESFYKDLEFGTGGIRGIMGAGTNKLNIYTVRKVAQGLSNYISNEGTNAKRKGVVIAYDTRNQSKKFAENIALTLTNNGIKVFLFEDTQPTPMLSFAVRHLNAFNGIMITASHNPPAYNGIKVYNQYGSQFNLEDSNKLIKFIQDIKYELNIKISDKEKAMDDGLLCILDKSIESDYLSKISSIIQNKKLVRNYGNQLNIIYSPLHGTSGSILDKAFSTFGFTNYLIVEEQAVKDPYFSTVKSPNPEEYSAFDYLIQYGKEKNADILIATDPDADRLGIAVLNHNGDYELLNGNQTGALMLNYLLENLQDTDTKNYYVYKTIVTSELGAKIAKEYNVNVFNTLTGFKFIAEQIEQLESPNKFLFGYEESYGYLLNDEVRDKDAIQSSILISEMALYYKQLGKTLLDVLYDLYIKYGYHKEMIISKTYEGLEGEKKINQIISLLRNHYPKSIADLEVVVIEDYQKGKRYNITTNEIEDITLPISNVLKFILNDDSTIIVRPSGTEPKIKFYIQVTSSTEKESINKLERIQNYLEKEVIR